MMRVPLMQGLPWQTAGSTEILAVAWVPRRYVFII
jgi:hypothetical protein